MSCLPGIERITGEVRVDNRHAVWINYGAESSRSVGAFCAHSGISCLVKALRFDPSEQRVTEAGQAVGIIHHEAAY